jgi:hypothetical protein
MSKTILVLISLLHALAAYDLNSILRFIGDVPLGDKIYPSKDGISYLKLAKMTHVFPTKTQGVFELRIVYFVKKEKKDERLDDCIGYVK